MTPQGKLRPKAKEETVPKVNLRSQAKFRPKRKVLSKVKLQVKFILIYLCLFLQLSLRAKASFSNSGITQKHSINNKDSSPDR